MDTLRGATENIYNDMVIVDIRNQQACNGQEKSESFWH